MSTAPRRRPSPTETTEEVDAATTEAAPTRLNRNDVRRARTRASLLGAGLHLMGQRGIDAVTIAEIAAEADVAFGSFYNHFESKDALVDAIIRELLDILSDTIDTATATIEDPLVALSAAFRMLHRAAVREPELTAFIQRAALSDDRVLEGITARARQAIERVVADGQITLPDVDIAVLMVSGASLLASRGVLDGRLEPGNDTIIAEMLLRLLGVAPAKAAKLATLPLPGPPRDS